MTGTMHDRGDFAAIVERNLRRNMVANFTHGMLGMTGFRILYAPTLLPAWLLLISDSNLVVGLGQALLQIGLVATPLWSAAALEHRTRIMPAAMRYGMVMRLSVLGLALSAWFAEGALRIALALACLLLLGLSNGMQRVAFQMLIGKLIPVDRRGRLQGWRNLVGGAVAALLSYLAGRWLIETNALGDGFATTFLAAFFLTSLGLMALRWGVIEPDSPTVRPPSRVRERLRDIPALMADTSYRHFVTAQALAMAGRIAAPFYILIASRTLALDGHSIGLLSLAFLGADTLSNVLWGYAGDRMGHKWSMTGALAIGLTGFALLLVPDSPAATIAAFAAFGAGSAGFALSAQTMVLEFGAMEDLPMRIALSTMVEGSLLAIGPLVGSVILLLAGPEPLLACGAVLTLAALVMLATRVTDPRVKRAMLPVD